MTDEKQSEEEILNEVRMREIAQEVADAERQKRIDEEETREAEKLAAYAAKLIADAEAAAAAEAAREAEEAERDAAALAAEEERKAQQEAYWNSPEFIEQRRLDEIEHRQNFVARLVLLVKEEAARRINAIAPIHKQLNTMRENPAHQMFAEIDAIRARSNAIEGQILTTPYEDLQTFNLKDAWA